MFLLKLVRMSFGSAGCQPGPSQQEELQALAALGSIAPFMLADYMFCQGNNCLLLLLDLCVGAGRSLCSSFILCFAATNTFLPLLNRRHRRRRHQGSDEMLYQNSEVGDVSGRPVCEPGSL